MSNQNPNGTPSAHSLFASAVSAGTLTQAAANVIVPNMTSGIQAAINGTKVEDVDASEVILLGLLFDDSGSMEEEGNNRTGQRAAKIEVAREGGNLVVDAMKLTKQADGILVHMAFLNDAPLCPFVSISQAPQLNDRNYRATGGTPLLDKSAILLAATMAKRQEFADNGVPSRSIVLIVTDGQELHSTTHRRPEDVAPLVKSALATEMVIVAFMGIAEGRTQAEQDKSKLAFTDFAKRMGIHDQWILTPDNDPHSIRQAFMMASRSMVRASQATNFSQAAGGGFASP